MRIIAVALAIAGINARIRLLGVFATLIVANFGIHLAGLGPPYPYRLAHVAVLAFYAAIALAGLVAAAFRIRFAPALAAFATLAAALVAAEAAIEQIVPLAFVAPPRTVWSRAPEPDATLGELHRPYAILTSVYRDNPRGYFQRADSASSEYRVTHTLNALGCRGTDYPIPRPADRKRIVVLGGAPAFGAGVRDGDTFAARMEQSLNAAPTQPDRRAYDVINCAVDGYATREQRIFFEQIAARYQPDLVILAMSAQDNVSRFDRERLGYVHEPKAYERLLLSLYLLQRARLERRLTRDYSGAVEEVAKLSDACRTRGARLAVAIFRNDELSYPWSDLVTAVSQRFQGADLPVLDLGPALLKDHAPQDLAVDAADRDPNEIAHRVAAEAIETFLRRQRLLG
jgi:hypothetical protein